MQPVDGVNRRRGQRRASKGKASSALFFYCLATIIFILFIVTWIIIHQKTNKALHDIAETTAEARNLAEILPPATPPGTSLVECTIKTPSNAKAEGVLTITVRHDLSPIASQVFLDLIDARHFNGNYIFRVLKGFVAQWGIRHKGLETVDYRPTKEKDVITKDTLSNVRATLSFAGGNPGTKQVFINLGDNRRLDKENSRPFATVDDASMTIMDQVYAGYKDGQGQVKAMNQGVDAMKEQFPNWSQIEGCQIKVRYQGAPGSKTETE